MRTLIMIIRALLGFYPVAGEVVENTGEVSVIETVDGNMWECLDDIPIGQNVMMFMYNNKTPVVEDDIILYIKK